MRLNTRLVEAEKLGMSRFIATFANAESMELLVSESQTRFAGRA
jgi:hypothetical protein